VGNDRWVAAVAHKYNAGSAGNAPGAPGTKMRLDKGYGGALHSACRAVSVSST